MFEGILMIVMVGVSNKCGRQRLAVLKLEFLFLILILL